MKMKKLLVIVAIAAAFVIGVRAQSIGGIWRGSAVVFPIDPAVTLATCATQQPPLTGVTYYCQTGAGAAISCNGAAYVNGVNCTAASAGVASISVNGGTPQTGAVVLKIPTTATSTATFASNGAATVTTTIQ
jgi:hypothetical protein